MYSKHHISNFFLVVIYAVGIIAISAGYKDIAALTPLTLAATFIIMVMNHQGKLKQELIILGVIFLWGFLIEAAGVASGKIFGAYSYGNNLGFKLFSVPVVIGLNWSLLVYSTAQAARVLLSSVFPAACVGSIIMVALDVLIEPVAVKLDFWQWQHHKIPLQNYLAWFLVSFAAHYFYQKLSPILPINKTAPVILVLHFLFFGILNLTLKP
jgi:putative membrane protein